MKPGEDKAAHAAHLKGKLNFYTCQGCGRIITTRDLDAGTTPFMIGCHTEGGPCPKGVMMYSAFYRVQEMPDCHVHTSHVWYRPETLAGITDQWTREHISNGGLILRPATDADHPKNEPRDGLSVTPFKR